MKLFNIFLIGLTLISSSFSDISPNKTDFFYPHCNRVYSHFKKDIPNHLCEQQEDFIFPDIFSVHNETYHLKITCPQPKQYKLAPGTKTDKINQEFGYNSNFGRIYIRSNSSVDLQFTFLDKDNKQRTPLKVMVTFWNIEQTEYIKTCKHKKHSYSLGNNVEQTSSYNCFKFTTNSKKANMPRTVPKKDPPEEDKVEDSATILIDGGSRYKFELQSKRNSKKKVKNVQFYYSFIVMEC